MGPIDYLVVEFPGDRLNGEGLRLLVDLVNRGIIRVLDLAFIQKKLDGSVCGLAVADLDPDGELGLAVFQGAASGLLGTDDLEEAGSVLVPDSSAVVLVYENHWAVTFIDALKHNGGHLVASGRIPAHAALAALEVADLGT